MLQIQNISKEYSLEPVLTDVSFDVAPGEKIAVVGRNGIGKSTLLKIISGQIEQDSGKIQTSSNEAISYLPQKVVDNDLNNKVVDYLSNKSDKEIFEIEKLLPIFKLDEKILDKQIKLLSGGQKTKICLLKVLLQDSTYIILDEPTNNLDIETLEWLESYIKESSSGFIIVSHDRRFLDNVVNKIVEIKEDRTAFIEKGSYSKYLTRVKQREEKQMSEYEDQQEEIGRLQESTQDKKKRAAMGTKYETKDNDKMQRDFKREKSKKSARDSKSIEKRIDQMEEIDAPEKKNKLNIEINNSDSFGNNSISILDVVVGYEDFSAGPFNLKINFGDKICFIGPNGAGKTTLLKTILSELEPKSGEITIGSKIKFGNLTQEHSNLPETKTIIQFILEKTEAEDKVIFNTLKKFNFTEKQIRGEISKLSPGQKTRVTLAMFTLEKINTIILDEPTNHLDIEALMAIEESIQNYEGTVIIISHDRYLIEQINPDIIYKVQQDGVTRVQEI